MLLLQNITDVVSDTIQTTLNTTITGKLIEHGTLITGIFIGLIIAFIYDKYVGSKKLLKSHQNSIRDKDEVIKAYLTLVNDRFDAIEPEVLKLTFIKRLKKFFKYRAKGGI